jgi:type 1 glutamine amidotransferase
MPRLLLLALALSPAAAPPGRPDKIKVLIVDGQNNHNYKAMTPFMKDQLEKSGLFSVDVSTSPPAAPKAPQDDTPEKKAEREKARADLWAAWRPKFTDYNVVVSNYNGERWPAEVSRAFEEYVRNGGGFYGVHAANNAFSGWKEYDQMIGLGWRGNQYGKRVFYNENDERITAEAGDGPGAGHGAQHEFKIRVRDAEHPITKGMPKEWLHAQDELYQGQRGPAEKMQILLSAFADKAKGGTGVSEPMLWVIPYGKGQVVTNVMGHENGKALQCVGFVTILLRSCEWLATGKTGVAIPENFPTAEKVSLIVK